MCSAWVPSSRALRYGALLGSATPRVGGQRRKGIVPLRTVGQTCRFERRFNPLSLLGSRHAPWSRDPCLLGHPLSKYIGIKFPEFVAQGCFNLTLRVERTDPSGQAFALFNRY